MPWMIKKFQKCLEIVGDPTKASFDPEVYETIINICGTINDDPECGTLLNTAAIDDTFQREGIYDALNDLEALGPLRIYQEYLAGWPNQIAYVVYTEDPPPKNQRISGPGFLLFNVRLGQQACMLKAWKQKVQSGNIS